MVKIMFLGCFCDLFTLSLFSKLDSTKFIIFYMYYISYLSYFTCSSDCFFIVIDCNYYVCSVLRRKKLNLES